MRAAPNRWRHDERRRDKDSSSAPSNPRTERSTKASIAYTVEVVDGSGVGLPWEPVTARFDFGGGDERIVSQDTDGCGRARFATPPVVPVSIEFEAHGETTGPIRPSPGKALVIET